jgi:hypothetical protein
VLPPAGGPARSVPTFALREKPSMCAPAITAPTTRTMTAAFSPFATPFTTAEAVPLAILSSNAIDLVNHCDFSGNCGER